MGGYAYTSKERGIFKEAAERLNKLPDKTHARGKLAKELMAELMDKVKRPQTAVSSMLYKVANQLESGNGKAAKHATGKRMAWQWREIMRRRMASLGLNEKQAEFVLSGHKAKMTSATIEAIEQAANSAPSATFRFIAVGENVVAQPVEAQKEVEIVA